MKLGFTAFCLSLLLSISANAADQGSLEEQLKLCQQDCLAISEPGYQLKSCLAECDEMIDEEEAKLQYCNSYEEDCDRDDDDSEI